MADSEQPEFFEKRRFLYSDDVPVDEAIAVGRKFMDAERYSDALEFFDRARSHEDVCRVAEIAMDNGDTAIWRRCKRILGEEPDAPALVKLAVRAEELGKYSFAIEARRRLGDEEEVERLRGRFASPDAL